MLAYKQSIVIFCKKKKKDFYQNFDKAVWACGVCVCVREREL